jgi:hypothetical protein
LVNSVQTYCGLEIDIIAIRPSTSWVQRVDDVASVIEAETGVVATGMFFSPWMIVPYDQ